MSLETYCSAPAFNALLEIWYLGAYDNLETESGGVIIDAGANVGDFTLKASRWVGDNGIVVAIEPIRENLTILKRNLARNRISNVITIDKAVSDCKCDVFLDGVKVRGTSIDELTEELGIERVDSIKLDIEGSESSAIRGCSRTIRHVTHVAVETHSNTLLGEVSSSLASHGFFVYRPSFSAMGRTMSLKILQNPSPFVATELSRVQNWKSTGGPFSWNIISWFYQRRRPDWFNAESGLGLLAADRVRMRPQDRQDHTILQ